MLVCNRSMKFIANHIQELPFINTPVLESGIFQFKGLPSNEAYIELERTSATLIPTSPWCCPKDANFWNKDERQTIGPFQVPHTKREFSLKLCDYMGARAYNLPGFQQGLLDISGEAQKQFETLSLSMRLVQEYRFVNALKGVVLDADGQSVIIDLYKALNLTQTPINWDFASTTFDIDVALSDLTQFITLALKGGMMTGGTIYLHPKDFNCLIQLKKLEKWAEACCAAQDALNSVKQGGMARAYRRGAWTFKEYFSSQVLNPITGNPVGDFVAKGSPLVVPNVVGVEMYEYLVAPPVLNSTIHKIANQLIYTNFAPLKDEFEQDSGYHGKIEANFLPIVKRIGAIPKLNIVGCN
jgi:Phage major capsid protein E